MLSATLLLQIVCCCGGFAALLLLRFRPEVSKTKDSVHLIVTLLVDTGRGALLYLAASLYLSFLRIHSLPIVKPKVAHSYFAQRDDSESYLLRRVTFWVAQLHTISTSRIFSATRLDGA